MSAIHPTAIVDKRAELAGDVEVGPYSVIGPGVRIGAGTRLIAHVVIGGKTTIGRGNVFHPFSVIGGDAQIKKQASERSKRAGEKERIEGPPREAVEIGDANVVREHVTINSSTIERATILGSNNLLMAGCHVAHDVVVGSGCVIANAVQLAGHVVVEDFVGFGGLSGVAQRVRIGESAFVAAGAMCERDVPPFVIVQGDRARVRALNVVGLERRGVPAASIALLRRAYAKLFVRNGEPFAQIVSQLDRSDPWVTKLADALGRD